MKIVGVIPSRYQSTRLPGKPLSDICGKPMIWWVYQRALKVSGLEDVYVATDSDKIMKVCNELNINCILTRDDHPSGVDRLSEVATKVKADYYVLIQGDEPLIEPSTIEHMLEIIEKYGSADTVLTYKTPIKNPVDAVNTSVIKIVTDLKDNILFASRSAIPYPKDGLDFTFYKTVGVYAYPHDILKKYPSLKPGPVELIEGHDIIRMLEHGIQIKAFPYETSTISVDTKKDLERVRKIMTEKINKGDI